MEDRAEFRPARFGMVWAESESYDGCQLHSSSGWGHTPPHGHISPPAPE